MRRIIATMGILGLALLGSAATANAAPPSNPSGVHSGGSTANPHPDKPTTPDNSNKPDSPTGQPGNGDKPDKGDKPGNGNGNGGGSHQPGDGNGNGGGSHQPGDGNGNGGGKGGDKGDKDHHGDKGDKDHHGDKGDKDHHGDKDDCEEPANPPVHVPVTPPAVKPVKPVTPPAGAAQGAPAPVVNAGFNVQTAVDGTQGGGIPLWLSVLTGLLTAGAATVLLRGVARGRSAS